jgi:hypothetical protein
MEYKAQNEQVECCVRVDSIAKLGVLLELSQKLEHDKFQLLTYAEMQRYADRYNDRVK